MSINEKTELSIRRGYSKHQNSFDSLSLWVKNTFGELKCNDSTIYSVHVRVKEIESLIRKVEKLSKSGSNIKDFDDVKAQVKDLVGARLIVFGPSSVMLLHGMIVRHDRLIIEKLKLHVNEDNSDSKFLRDIERNTPLDVKKEKETNKTGYMGVHYIIKPKPVDEIYKGCFYEANDSSPKLFPRFELQLRTIMNHAWSEVQHKAIYKGKSVNFDELAGRVATISPIIARCDSILGSLMQTAEDQDRNWRAKMQVKLHVKKER